MGELCVTTGLLLVLFTAYLLWGTGRYVDQEQERLFRELARTWEAPRGTTERVRLGDGVALIRIPKLGDGFRYVVVEGVGTADLRKGPGHYPGTAMPGQLGNFVVSGHRTTYGGPFNRLDELDIGDEIVIDTRRWRFTYRVTQSRVVPPTASEAIARVPFRPGRKPAKRYITLTTCHPEYSAAERLIVVGELAERVPRIQPVSAS
ncbi:class E sortase [Thermomonospora cellulosilytica]|uniref:Sortase A n=1 Tax=Thermomonospora cellulosilytica TaxID=1411118 RepID=A0A7W3MU34_9ACTN|nr:class E sortase [Thermomonospora cellulosilytica]MBA9001852.1 sortase A [Thermomonospora cellulosilytica]